MYLIDSVFDCEYLCCFSQCLIDTKGNQNAQMAGTYRSDAGTA